MLQWFSDWWDSVVIWIKSIFMDFMNFMTDLPIKALEEILGVLLTIIESLELPDFVTDGLDSAFSALPPSVLYLLNAVNFYEGLSLIGTAYTFRLARKLLTLFQW